VLKGVSADSSGLVERKDPLGTAEKLQGCRAGEKIFDHSVGLWTNAERSLEGGFYVESGKRRLLLWVMGFEC
jgi:hypothetical protein